MGECRQSENIKAITSQDSLGELTKFIHFVVIKAPRKTYPNNLCFYIHRYATEFFHVLRFSTLLFSTDHHETNMLYGVFRREDTFPEKRAAWGPQTKTSNIYNMYNKWNRQSYCLFSRDVSKFYTHTNKSQRP